MSLDDAPLPGCLRDEARSSRSALDPENLVAQSGWLRAVARNLVRDPMGAEDVAQETLLAALATPPRDVPDDAHLRAWLGRVAFNLSRLDLRSGGRRRARERVVARSEALPAADEELEAAAARSELVKAMRALDEPGRQVLQLRYFEGLSTADIAARLGVSELAVRKRLWRARERLRASLEPRRRALGAWLGFSGWRRLARLEVAGLAAAGVTAVLAIDFEAERRSPLERPVPSVARLAELAPAAEDGGFSAPAADRPGSEGRRRLSPTPPPRPELERRPPELPVRAVERHYGLVLDLAGTPRAGLAVVVAESPSHTLAWTDVLGGFTLEAQVDGLEFHAQGEGLTTVVPARFAAGASEALVLVAPASPFTGTVRASGGAPLPTARFELLATEAAFAELEHPVQLPSPVLARTSTDAEGQGEFAELARAEGLLLRISCPGFEPIEQETLTLGAEAIFELQPEGAGPELAGTVSLPDGRPAVGARVRLALAETTTNERGAFRLPLRGLGADTRLEVRGRGFAPVFERDLVRRLERGARVDDLTVVLDRPLDPVQGELRGPLPSFAGWRVLAFSGDDSEGPYEARCDAAGRFELELPRGSAELYALAPDRAESHAGRLEDTRKGRAELAVCLRAGFEERIGLRGDDGRALAGAEVALELDLAPGRSVTWGRLVSDAQGTLAYVRGPGAEVALAVRHVALGPRALTVAAAPEVVLVRARTVRLASVPGRSHSFRVLDAQGATLGADGPLGPAEAFALSSGRSAMTFVPPQARWVELLGDAGPELRLALQAEPGTSVTLVP